MGKKHKKRKSINQRREGEFVSMVNSIEREREGEGGDEEQVK